jgi:hypothetical protein
MKTKRKVILQADLGAEGRFEQDRATPEEAFERLRSRLLAGRIEAAGARWETPLRDAASDAAAVAWTTPIPLLVFPALFEEKAATAILHTRRQARILEKSRELIAV